MSFWPYQVKRPTGGRHLAAAPGHSRTYQFESAGGLRAERRSLSSSHGDGYHGPSGCAQAAPESRARTTTT